MNRLAPFAEPRRLRIAFAILGLFATFGVMKGFALQQQLGVKLESKKATVNILTVDHAEKQPTEN